MVGFRMSDVCACLCTLSLEDVSSQALSISFSHVGDRQLTGTPLHEPKQVYLGNAWTVEHLKVASRENMAFTIQLQDDSLLDYGWKTRPNDG